MRFVLRFFMRKTLCLAAWSRSWRWGTSLARRARTSPRPSYAFGKRRTWRKGWRTGGRQRPLLRRLEKGNTNKRWVGRQGRYFVGFSLWELHLVFACKWWGRVVFWEETGTLFCSLSCKVRFSLHMLVNGGGGGGGLLGSMYFVVRG